MSSPAPPSSLAVDGARIAYRRQGTGPAILVTHGFSASSHMFGGTTTALAASNTVITWDVRGHGATDGGTDPERYTADRSVADMAAILDECGIDRAVIAGHSMGGFLSLRFWLRHPERVRALVLIGTGPGYRNDEARAGWNEMCAGMAESLETSGFDQFAGGDEFDPSVHRYGPERVALAARGILTQHDAQVIDALPSIDVPTLVVIGANDAQFIAGSRYMADRIPGASLAVIADAGHAPMITHLQRFERPVLEFLGDLPRDETNGQ